MLRTDGLRYKIQLNILIPLDVFSLLQKGDSKPENQRFLYLTHQLDLFGKLCYGRNKFAIDVITKALNYLTWEEAFTCLSNEQLPDDLRAKYCDLIIGE